jgi:hypothetical protein
MFSKRPGWGPKIPRGAVFCVLLHFYLHGFLVIVRLLAPPPTPPPLSVCIYGCTIILQVQI